MEIAGTDIERSTLVQVGVGGASIVVFIAMVAYVGVAYGVTVGTDPRVVDLEPAGGMALVGVLVAFVVLMIALGTALSDELTED